MHPKFGRRVLETELPPGFSRTVKIYTFEAATALTPWLYGDRPALYW